jgi:hypothetical protein
VALPYAYKDLCIDAVDPELLAPFWSAALGLSAEPRDGSYVLTDAVPEHTVWLNRVPEAKSVKHRVHLDLHVGSVDELLKLGATVLDTRQPWTVLADPEGGELCAFVRAAEALPRYRLYELGVDSADPRRIAGWWGEVLGLTPQPDAEEGFWWLPSGAGLPCELVFAPVPEPKTIKNRVHWDIWGEREDLLARGAALLRPQDDEIGWYVLADPEGNEFCVFARQPGTA